MRNRTRPGKSVVVLLVACCVLALVVGAGVGLFMSRKGQAGAEGGKKHGRKEPKQDEVEVKAVMSLGELVVNLADPETLRYAKLSVAFGLEQVVPEQELKAYEPMLKDAVIDVVTRKRFKELRRKSGLPKLKREILKTAQERVPKAKLVRVYLETFAMQ